MKANSMGRPYLMAASCNLGFGILASFNTEANLEASCVASAGKLENQRLTVVSDVPPSG